MEASIGERQIRDFIRLLQCAAKFGDDLNMHANKDAWELAVTNSTKSAFCLFKLSAHGHRTPSNKGFFQRYRALGNNSVQLRKGVKCSLLVKSVLAVLGKASSANNVERLDLKIVDPEQTLRSKRRRQRIHNRSTESDTDDYEGSDEEREQGRGAVLIMKLVCRHGVTKKHSLHLGASEFLRAEVNPDSTPSSFGISAKALRDMLDHFSIASSSVSTGIGSIKNENQLAWRFGRDEVRVKSWEGVSKDLTTEIKLHPNEFEDYHVESESVELTLPMKEFRAGLTLAEQLGISLTIAYSEATQPLTLTSADDTSEDGFTIFCAIATTTSTAFDDDFIPKNGSGSDRKPTTSTTTRSTTREPTETSESTREPWKAASRTVTDYYSEPATKRPRLSLGPERHTQATVVVTSAPAATRLRETGLFLPGGSQVDLGEKADQADPVSPTGQPEQGSQLRQSQADRVSGSQTEGAGPSKTSDEVDLPRSSQRMSMTPKEVMDLSGMGDLDTEELMDLLDDAEEDDEMHGVKHDSPGRGEDEENQPPAEVEIARQVPEPHETGHNVDDHGLPKEENIEDVVDEEGEAQEEMIEPDATEELPSTQHETATEGRKFESFFDDDE